MGLLDVFAPNVGKLQASRDIPGLTKAAQHKNPEIRSQVVAALGRIGDATVLPALTVCLRDDVVEIRRAAVETLGAIGGPRALRLLAALIKDESRVADAMAREFFGSTIVIGADPAAFVDFAQGVQRQRGVRDAAEAAIARIGADLPSVSAAQIAMDQFHTTKDDVILLDRADSLADLARADDLPKSGARVTFTVGEHLMDGLIFFDEQEQVWLGIPDWRTWRERE